MSQVQLTLVDNVCSRCGQAAPRYRRDSTRCRQCTIAAAIERNKAKGKDYWTAAIRRHRQALDPAVRSARKQVESERRAQKAGKPYSPRGPRPSEAERRLDLETRAKARAVKSITRARQRRAAPPPLTPMERYRFKMATDPCFRINIRMRVAIGKALKGKKDGRKWELLVGYTSKDLEAHLERQLPRGCAMRDFASGKLHIDHIIPKSMFDVTKPEELRACWALTNLRPLRAKANLKKGSKRVTLL